MAVDDAYTKSLLHLDGADGSTTITDESGKTWTAVGTAQIDTAQSVFGGASLLLDGNSDYIYTADHDDFYFDGDFTIDLRTRWNALPTSGNVQAIWNQFVDVSNTHVIYLYNVSGTQKFYWQVFQSAVKVFEYIGNAGVSADTWYHLAFVRNGNDWKVFKDGTQLGSTITDSSALTNLAGTVYYGQYNTGWYFNGWMDEPRISKGIARWTANFTPPTAAYAPGIPKIKTINSIAAARIKTVNGIAVADAKSVQGIS